MNLLSKTFTRKFITDGNTVIFGTIFFFIVVPVLLAILEKKYDLEVSFVLLISIALGWILTAFFADDNTNVNLLYSLGRVFSDIQFNGFIFRELSSFIYFICNIGFWSFNIFNILETGLNQDFLTYLLFSFLTLLVVRISLELSIVIFKISENTSN